MRVVPRFNITPKAVRRLWRKSKAHLTLLRVYYSLELTLFLTIYFIAFSGKRLQLIDSLGHRADTIISLLLIAAFAGIHVLARRALLPKIERRYQPVRYDERKIFFELGPGSQHVTTVDQLYQTVADRIRNAFEGGNAALFVRDDATANFNLRVLSGDTGAFFVCFETLPKWNNRSADNVNCVSFNWRHTRMFFDPPVANFR
jgi:hypothetical protein